MRKRIATLMSGCVLLVLVLGSTGAGAAEPGDRTFFLRGKGCGATEQFWLSTESGPDEYDGCGTIGGVPFDEVAYQAGVPLPSSFSATDGLPVTLDASRDVSGTVRGESWFGPGVPGAGQVVVDVALRGVDARGQEVQIGSKSVQALNTGADGVQVNFTLDVPDALNGVELNELTFDVQVRGANWNSGNIGLEGDSKFTLPILIPAA